jgi:hypothetical protein
MGENWWHTNTKINFTHLLYVFFIIVLVCQKFSPILILLFQHSRKSEGVRKFVSENPSYKLLCGLIDLQLIQDLLKSHFEKFPEKNQKVTFRGCQLETGKSDACELVFQKAGKMNNVKIEHCSECNTAGCNGSNQHYASLWQILIPITIFLYSTRKIAL